MSAVDEGMPEWAIRLEAKVDVALSRQGDRLDRHGHTLDDHETRLRAQEQKAVVTPTGLMATLVACFSVLGGLVALIQNVT